MPTPEWTPKSLLQVSGAYWSSFALHAAVELRLITSLGREGASPQKAAQRLNASERGVSTLLSALAAMGLLRIEEGRFVPEPGVWKFLSEESTDYLGHIIRHHHQLVGGWAKLDEAVRRGGAVRESSVRSEQDREAFLLGMVNQANAQAPLIVPGVDLKGRRHLLDLGGGPGTWAFHFCRANRGLSATVFDLPTSREFFERSRAVWGLELPVRFEAGDYLHQAVPGRYDVAWLSHVLHGEGPEGCAVILKRAADALEPGGLLLIHDFILDEDRAGPLFAALFSLNMLMGTAAGRSYTEGELQAMMGAAGAQDVQKLPVTGPNGSGVVAGIVG